MDKVTICGQDVPHRQAQTHRETDSPKTLDPGLEQQDLPFVL